MTEPLTAAYLSLGSNLQPRRNLAFAVDKIKHDLPNSIVSSVYQTSAVGFSGDQFLNLAMQIKTHQTLQELLNYTDALEQTAGRVRVKRGNFDDRTLDVDVIIYGDLVGTYEGRVWPAQDLTQYGHVLKPLAEIAEHSCDPLTGQSFKTLWDQFADKQKFEDSTQRFDTQWLKNKSTAL